MARLPVPGTPMTMQRDRDASRTAWSYLLLYNAMFIVPLAAVFLLTFLGLRTPTLLEWSRCHVVVGKVLLGLFFLAMAVLIVLL